MPKLPALRAATLIALLAGEASAMSFGLGTGAAKAAKKTIDKAAGLPTSCSQQRTGLTGSVAFTAAPINPADVFFVTPLGNINPPGHTFPSDHIYFYYVNLHGTPNYNVSFPVYAIADGYISNILAGSEAGAVQYKITITHTDTFSSYLDHVASLNPTVFAPAGPISNDGNTCAWIPVKAGQMIGSIGGIVGENAFDLGVTNLQNPQPFINPARYGFIDFSDAPLKYYAGSLQSSLYALVQRQTPDYLGSNEMDGIFCYDVPGTVSGNWAAQGSDPNWLNPDSWSQQLTFAYDVNYAAQINIAFGGMNGKRPFGPQTEGFGPWRVQPGALPPASVTVATGAYGYQLSYWDPGNGSSGGVFGLLMVQLLDANTLKAEYFDGNMSASAPFDANAVVYTR